ncbi:MULTISPECIES: hypothetical protein [Methylomicrobium]|nr:MULTISPECIES: hypothetical protein [Methylomicrobium]
MNIKRPKNKAPTVSKSMIIRSIASSTAIETGQPIAVIEAKLKVASKKYRHLKLAS